MPLYEYKCQQCQRHTEKRQKFSDPEITECPHCGGHLTRVLSAPAIAFKGGGWYADGYGNAKPKTSSEGASGNDTKTETAPAVKTTASGDAPGTVAGTSTAPAPAGTPSPTPTPASSKD